MLIILAGLPGTGKTNIAKCLAGKIKAVYLRIDTIEQAIIEAKLSDKEMGPAGYMVGYAVAKDNLSFGLTVIADSVNPLQITRETWRNLALEAKVPFIEVEFICSDQTEHRLRIESRQNDIQGLQLPSWQDVINREYEKWESKHLVIDTAKISMENAVTVIIQHLPE